MLKPSFEEFIVRTLDELFWSGIFSPGDGDDFLPPGGRGSRWRGEGLREEGSSRISLPEDPDIALIIFQLGEGPREGFRRGREVGL